MGTISDKLMRIINTKEDIRQALISKGYDVPTSIPFKEYAKMILDLPCNADSFPDIEGIVARYSASGLTNEQMAANPVWVDKTGNGYDLQLKNFAWGGMSGVGGYVDNWNSSADWAIKSYWVNSHTDHKLQFITASSVVQARLNNIYNAENVYKNILNVNGLTEAVNKGSVKFLRIIATDPITSKAIKTFSFETDGVIQISFDDVLQDYYVDYFLYGSDTKDIDITIEQLPLYPGALVFDGVDDCGTCNNFPILTKEKGYTVVVLRQWDQDFLNTTLTGGLLSTRNYSTGEGVAFEKIESSNKGYWNLGAGGIIDFAKSPFTWQTSKQYNNVGILKGDKNHGKPLCVGCGLSGGQQCGRFAIWELVILDHDATEEELTKIKDYFVKTYPWLFPDQAWTVTGKTNKDKDRATIANITGNGNNLVLSNFGFAKGSGYGLYNIQEFTNWSHVVNRGDIVKNGYSVTITNSKITGSSTNYNTDILYSYNSSSTTIIFKVTGLVDGQKIFLGRKSVTDAYVIDKDGIYRSDYNIPQEGGKVIVGIGTVGFTGECNITIEQIPEYEGYLVTDGVDDKIVSAESIAFTDTWTIITDAIFLGEKVVSAGILVKDIFDVRNLMEYGRVEVSVKGGVLLKVPTPSIKAICSDGRIYDADWNEYQAEPGTIKVSEGELYIGMWYDGMQFCSIAFKNIATYNGYALSKDDCIKAYNYLQTLKSK